MGTKYLIDTNVLLEYLAKTLPLIAHNFIEKVININFNVSIINRIEVLGHSSSNTELERFMDLAETFQLTPEVVKQTIELRKKMKTKLPDAIIAATALVHDFTIISRNAKDFQSIDGLQWLNPYDLI